MLGFTRTLVFSIAPDKGPAHTTSTCAWWDCRLFPCPGKSSLFPTKDILLRSSDSFCHDNLQNPSSSISEMPGPDRDGDRKTAHSDPAFPTRAGSQEKDGSPKEEGREQETEEGKRRGPRCRQLESTGSGIPNRPRFKSWHHTLPAMWP